MTQDAENEGPVETATAAWWVGRREGSMLERNIYLRVFEHRTRKVNMVADPGPAADFDALCENAKTKLRTPPPEGIMRVGTESPGFIESH